MITYYNPHYHINDINIIIIYQCFFIMGRDPVELAKRAKYKPPAMRVCGICYTKNHLSLIMIVVQAIL